ncbi:hypothetical protein GCM10008929_19530 [Alkalibacterium psychrotolerans]
MNDALGLIEVKGLSSAVNVADTMLKVASVELLGIEKANGFGWMTIKVSGNVGAVKASVDSGTAKAKESDAFVSSIVIPRPAEGIKDPFLKMKQPEDSSVVTGDKYKPEKKSSKQTVKDEESEEKKKDDKETLKVTSVKSDSKQTEKPDSGNKSATASGKDENGTSSNEVVKKNFNKPKDSSRQKPKTKRTVSRSESSKKDREDTSKTDQKRLTNKTN